MSTPIGGDKGKSVRSKETLPDTKLDKGKIKVGSKNFTDLSELLKKGSVDDVRAYMKEIGKDTGDYERKIKDLIRVADSIRKTTLIQFHDTPSGFMAVGEQKDIKDMIVRVDRNLQVAFIEADEKVHERTGNYLKETGEVSFRKEFKATMFKVASFLPFLQGEGVSNMRAFRKERKQLKKMQKKVAVKYYKLFTDEKYQRKHNIQIGLSRDESYLDENAEFKKVEGRKELSTGKSLGEGASAENVLESAQILVKPSSGITKQSQLLQMAHNQRKTKEIGVKKLKIPIPIEKKKTAEKRFKGTEFIITEGGVIREAKQGEKGNLEAVRKTRTRGARKIGSKKEETYYELRPIGNKTRLEPFQQKILNSFNIGGEATPFGKYDTVLQLLEEHPERLSTLEVLVSDNGHMDIVPKGEGNVEIKVFKEKFELKLKDKKNPKASALNEHLGVLNDAIKSKVQDGLSKHEKYFKNLRPLKKHKETNSSYDFQRLKYEYAREQFVLMVGMGMDPVAAGDKVKELADEFEQANNLVENQMKNAFMGVSGNYSDFKAHLDRLAPSGAKPKEGKTETVELFLQFGEESDNTRFEEDMDMTLIGSDQDRPEVPKNLSKEELTHFMRPKKYTGKHAQAQEEFFRIQSESHFQLLINSDGSMDLVPSKAGLSKEEEEDYTKTRNAFRSLVSMRQKQSKSKRYHDNGYVNPKFIYESLGIETKKGEPVGKPAKPDYAKEWSYTDYTWFKETFHVSEDATPPEGLELPTTHKEMRQLRKALSEEPDLADNSKIVSRKVAAKFMRKINENQEDVEVVTSSLKKEDYEGLMQNKRLAINLRDDKTGNRAYADVNIEKGKVNIYEAMDSEVDWGKKVQDFLVTQVEHEGTQNMDPNEWDYTEVSGPTTKNQKEAAVFACYSAWQKSKGQSISTQTDKFTDAQAPFMRLKILQEISRPD